jgi:hypothetical protein
LEDTNVNELIHKYFPESNLYDEMNSSHPDHQPTQEDNLVTYVDDLAIEEDDVMQCVKQLNVSSSPGVDSWSYSFIKELILMYGDDEYQKQIIAALIKAVNSFYKASFCKNAAQLWSLTRVVFIPKNGDINTDKPLDQPLVRPIGVTSALYRLFGKIISYKLKDLVSKQLCKNHQLGIGIADGCSIGATVINRYLNDDPECNMILINDISNAFNETSHLLIEEGLGITCPALIPLFRFIYGNKPKLIMNNQLVGQLHTGTLQGDALSMIFFNVALDVVLSKIKNVIPECRMMAYCDDLTVLWVKVLT